MPLLRTGGLLMMSCTTVKSRRSLNFTISSGSKSSDSVISPPSFNAPNTRRLSRAKASKRKRAHTGRARAPEWPRPLRLSRTTAWSLPEGCPTNALVTAILTSVGIGSSEGVYENNCRRPPAARRLPEPSLAHVLPGRRREAILTTYVVVAAKPAGRETCRSNSLCALLEVVKSVRHVFLNGLGHP